MKNYVITIQYNGKTYSGWQIQDGRTTIEGELARAVFEVSGEKTTIFGSGRTDAGVSAIAQVANFQIEKEFQPSKLMMALNAHLPQDISVTNCKTADADFNARISAKRKTYEYYFYVSQVRMPLLDEFALQVKFANIDAMQQACKFLLGEHDFSSFVSANSGKTNFVRTVFDAKIENVSENLHKFVITGNGFLYNMVRIVMGTLVAIGMNKALPEDMKTIIDAKDRTKAGKTMPAVGLVLREVKYK